MYRRVKFKQQRLLANSRLTHQFILGLGKEDRAAYMLVKSHTLPGSTGTCGRGAEWLCP